MDHTITSSNDCVNMSETVMITGVSGLVGAHILKYLLLNTDWDVVCPVSFKHRGIPERITTVWDETAECDGQGRTSVVYCDLSAPIQRSTTYLFGNVNYIINCASESHTTRSIQDPVPFIQNNVMLMTHLLEYARTLVNLKGFYQLSTDEVYGPTIDEPHKEWAPIRPSSPYSASKAAQEAIAISYWSTYEIPLVLVNSMNIVGEMQDLEKFIPLVIGKLYRDEMLDIHHKDGVVGSRIYIHAHEVADAIYFLMNNAPPVMVDDSHWPDRWNIVGNAEVDNLELARMIAQAMKNDHNGLQYRLVTSHHGKRYAMSGQKLTNAGWTSREDFSEVVKNIVSWTETHDLWQRLYTRGH